MKRKFPKIREGKFDFYKRIFFIALTLGLREQNFLGQPWIPVLFKIVPKRYRRSLAMKLLAMSPHYLFIYNSTKYPSTRSRVEISEAEYERNVASRRKICEQILRPYLHPQMTVLDFGCGPGWLAREVAKYSKQVLAVDISRGTIACARELNNSDNISYYTNNGKDLSILGDSSVDLIYSFAVVQHLSEELFEGFLKEFFRVLKPQGKVVCHIALTDKPYSELEHKNNSYIFRYLKRRFGLRCVSRRPGEVSQKITNTGFKAPAIIPVKQISNIEDDIAKQHLFVFGKP